MRVRPVNPRELVTEIVERIDAFGGSSVRVAVDGAPGVGTAEFADELVAPLRARGRQAVRVRMADYLRAASLRFEFGKRDPDSYYHDWFDHDGLRREVLDPLAEGGTGQVLPALWDAERDRSPRLERVRLVERGVVLVDGPLLLGAGLPFDLTVHLGLPDAALNRRVPAEDQWTLPALRRYAEQVVPEVIADCAVRVDRPDRPAIIDSLG